MPCHLGEQCLLASQQTAYHVAHTDAPQSSKPGAAAIAGLIGVAAAGALLWGTVPAPGALELHLAPAPTSSQVAHTSHVGTTWPQLQLSRPTASHASPALRASRGLNLAGVPSSFQQGPVENQSTPAAATPARAQRTWWALWAVMGAALAGAFLRPRPNQKPVSPNMAMAAVTGAVDLTVRTSHRVEHLRKLMAEQGLDAYLIPSSDPHMSEYVPKRYTQREYITGFDGSFGFVVLTHESALLWTDGRYFLQASQQLEAPTWTLMKGGQPGVPTAEQWLARNLPEGSVVGFDDWTLSVSVYQQISAELSLLPPHQVRLQPTESLVDLVWQGDQEDLMPTLPEDKVFIHELQYAGRSVADKLEDLAGELRAQKLDRILLTALDDVAWLLNLRGTDIDYNPVFMAYCIAAADGTAVVFMDSGKLTPEVQAHLAASGVTLRPYAEVAAALANTTTPLAYTFDPSLCNVKLKQALQTNPAATCTEQQSLVVHMKAIKNDVELAGMKACHLRDGRALARYFMWLEDQIAAGQEVTEVTGADRLEQFRAEEAMFRSPSFTTISSVDSNAAIVHYNPYNGDHRLITSDSMYLLDSGGQYLDGTTDCTRTVHFGTPTAKQQETFTLALKGHLALRNVIFPDTVTGHQLDVLARSALWSAGLDYNHGTGHGVGCFLNVHEGPHGISPRPNANKLKAGAVVSNEPGYYEDGAFGIRIENLCYFHEVETKYQMKRFLGMDDLTHVPIQAKLIDVSLLTDAEVTALNGYHAEVLERVGPLMAEIGSQELAWLENACKPITR